MKLPEELKTMFSKPYISELEEYLEKEVESIFKIKSKRVQETRDGKKFLLLTLEDKTGVLRAVDWYDAEENDSKLNVGNIISVKGKVVIFEDRLQLNISKNGISKLTEQEYELERFITKSERDLEDMYNELLSIIDTLQDEDYKTLLRRFFVEDKHIEKSFKKSPAGMRIHHSYIGGLLEHSLNVAKICDSIYKIYPDLDRELLLAGALIHDIGKIREYAVNQQGIEVTTEGELLGHIVMGVEMVSKKAHGLDQKKITKIKHLIASHHGEFEWGSPVLPKTKEALVLHFVENMDSKLNRVNQLVSKDNQERDWTDYDSNLSRRFFLG